jgi:hypothetical protein
VPYERGSNSSGPSGRATRATFPEASPSTPAMTRHLVSRRCSVSGGSQMYALASTTTTATSLGWSPWFGGRRTHLEALTEAGMDSIEDRARKIVEKRNQAREEEAARERERQRLRALNTAAGKEFVAFAKAHGVHGTCQRF